MGRHQSLKPCVHLRSHVGFCVCRVLFFEPFFKDEEEQRNPKGRPTTRSSSSSAQTNGDTRLVSLEGYYVSEWRHKTVTEGRAGCCFGRWIKGAWNERDTMIKWESGHIHSGVNDKKVIFPPCGRQYGRLLLGWQDTNGVELVELPSCGYIIIRNTVIAGSQDA